MGEEKDMEFPRTVYCFHCGKKFIKQSAEFENCPHCGKGFSDLTEEARYAVEMVLKGMLEQYKH